MAEAQLTVLVGPIAAGKGIVVATLTKCHPTLSVSVPVITRDPRPGELNGVRHYFVSAQEFDVMIRRGDMLEWASVHGNNKYRTPRGPVDEALTAGKSVFLGIDLTDVRQVRTNRPGAQFIFLAPSSWEEFRRRLIGRGTEGPEEQARRLTTVCVELEAASKFNHVMVNGDVERAVDELVRLVGLEQYLSESTTEGNTRMSGIVVQSAGITSLPIDDLLEHVDSEYTLVVFAAKRTRQTDSYNLQLQQNMIQFVGPAVDVQPDEKPPAVSPREINEGLLSLETSPEA